MDNMKCIKRDPLNFSNFLMRQGRPLAPLNFEKKIENDQIKVSKR